jgi:outer membrane translocation and assembly module TamA
MIIGLIGAMLVLGGCSNTRFLAEDELLYSGQRKVTITKVPEDMPNAAKRQLLQSGSSQKPNNSIFNRRVLPPIGLWTHNYMKKEERTKIGNWLYTTLSAPPVLVSDINPELQAQKIENDLFDLGYFQSNAWSRVDTSKRNDRRAMVEYYVEVGPSYSYREVEIDSSLLHIDSLLQVDEFRKQIKAGDQFDIQKLAEARSAISNQFQNIGYYYFNQELIELNADTALGNNRLDLDVRPISDPPEQVLTTYRIGQIEVRLSKSSDSASTIPVPFKYKDLQIFSQGNDLKPDVIYDALYFAPGDLYSLNEHQRTMARLNNLGVFSYVKINYLPSVRDSLVKELDVRIELILADQINFHLETDLVLKSTGFLGPGVTVGTTNSNAFGGAEKFQVDLKGGFEWQWGVSEVAQLGTFSYDFGINSGLTFPKLLLPWKHSGYKHLLSKETTINLNFDILNRVEYYSMFSALTSLKYSWGKTQTIRHSYTPVYLNSVSLLETTPAFDSIVEENIYIQKSFEEQFIFGMRYEFKYDNTSKRKPQNMFFSVGASTSGNLLDLIARIGAEESDRPYEVINTVYSQHVKLTTDFRYYLNGFNKTLAMRLYAGVGFPYLNSTVLPYVEQFFSGGAYSVRGFAARYVGPGSFYEENNSFIDQSGDVKLEANLEFRFGITRVTKGALFIDAGNIWLINEDENRPGSHFRFNSFYDQLAVGTGVGLRFDFNFFVLRTDMGIPLRTPYVQDDSNWLTGSGNPLSRAMFYFAIGYPF